MKKINDLGFKFRTTKDEEEKNNIEKELNNIIEDMKKSAIEKFKDESSIKQFLDNLVRFNNYSFNNQILIYLQDPDAQFVASKLVYNKMGYEVNKNDNEGIKIFIPRFYNIVKLTDEDNNITFKPYFVLTKEEKEKYKNKNDDSVVFYKQKLGGFSLGNVFNANDTTMPMDEIDSELNPVLEDNRASEIMDCFVKTIYKDGFKVLYDDFEDKSLKGFCNHENKKIVIRKGMGSLIQLKVLIHEYGHALAHKHLENNNLEYKAHRNKYETEAESISYVVSKYLGLPTTDYSLNYLYVYSKEKDFKEIDDSIKTIVNYSKRIINNFKDFYNKEYDLYSENKEISI